uniref:Sulfotransferase domain-containing protein n=1 Tax=Emiliania huxleyi TaxID=2903 RepID=A0A7S3RQR0_EMIHU
MHAVAAGRAALWNENAERSLLPMNGSAGYLELLSCPERRLAFTHVYKAAGSYVDERVCSACPRATCYLPCPPETLANCNCGYLDTAGAGTRTCRVGRKATLRRSHLGANPGMEAASGVRLFTVVRHPVQRFVSAASQLKSLGLLAANASCADTLRTVELRGLFDVHLVWTDQSAASPTRALNRPIRCPPPATDGLHGRRPRSAPPSNTRNWAQHRSLTYKPP